LSLFKAADSENRSMPSLPLIGEMPLTPAAMALAPLRRPVLQLFQLGLLTITLAGCGGGGGGGGDAPPPPAPPPVSTTSGLIPAAPAVGEVLEADAATLRPLTDGGSWQYRGTVQVGTEPASSYRNETTQRASGAAFEERSSNAFGEGEDTSVVRRLSDRIVSPVDIALPRLAPETVDFPQLLSPVRAGAQWTLYDRRVSNAFGDEDGDRVDETGDFAFYARVVGVETVTLPTLPALRAVRVDYIGAFRIRFSRDGSTSTPVTVVQSIWYAPQVGIVQARIDEPAVGSSPRRVATEQLLGFSAGALGLGLGLGPVRPALLGSNSVAPLILSVISRPDDLLRAQAGGSLAFESRLGGDLRVLSFAPGGSLRYELLLPGLANSTPLANDQDLVLLRGTGSGTFSFRRYGLDGRETTPAGGTELRLYSPGAIFTRAASTSAALSEGRLWLSADDEIRDPVTLAFVQRSRMLPFELGSGAAGAPVDLSPVGWCGASPLLAAGSRLHQVRQVRDADGSDSLWLTSVQTDGSAAPRQQLLPSGLLPGNGCRAMRMLPLVNGEFAMLWGPDFFGPSGSLPIFGVRVRADGTLVRSSTGPLVDERLSTVPVGYRLAGSAGRRLWFVREEPDSSLVPGDSSVRPGFIQTWLALDVVNDAPLTAQPVQTLRIDRDDGRSRNDWWPAAGLGETQIDFYGRSVDAANSSILATRTARLPLPR
jgi:hypothetical protein